MKLAIMQPYFLPYIGYWQLINYVDVFVIYDNIEYSKRGWINRNRYLLNGEAAYITVPLVKDSDFLDIRNRKVSEEFWKGRIKNQLIAAYRKAPYFDDTINVIDQIYKSSDNNLYTFLKYTIQIVLEVLQIGTKIVTSSEITEDRSKTGKDRVIDICHQIGADNYINPIGGVDLYDKKEFNLSGISLEFLSANLTPYDQFGKIFVPALSIVDVLMFNGVQGTRQMLDDFKLL